MSTPVATHNTGIALARYDMPADYDALYEVCEVLARSKKVIPVHLRDNPEDIFATALLARSLDIAMWPAMHGLYATPKGGLGMYVKLARALAERAGYIITPLDANDPEKIWKQKYAQVEIRKPGEDPFVAAYHWHEAVLGNLTHKDNWNENPVAMMIARASGRALNWKASAVTLGIAIRDDLYQPDENDPRADTGADSYTSVSGEAVAAPSATPVPGIAASVEELAVKASKARSIGGLNKILGTATPAQKDFLLGENYGTVTLGDYIRSLIKAKEPSTAPIRKKTTLKKTAPSADANAVLACGCFEADVLLEGGVHTSDTCTAEKTSDEMWAGTASVEPEDIQPAEEMEQ